MASIGFAKIKVVPDMSSFVSDLRTALRTSDPLAREIMALPNSDERDKAVVTRVGSKVYVLHHWSTTIRDGEDWMELAWTPREAFKLPPLPWQWRIRFTLRAIQDLGLVKYLTGKIRRAVAHRII